MDSKMTHRGRLPSVVQVGFAGTRKFGPPENGEAGWSAELDAQLFRQLVEILSSLPSRLGLASQHFLCGISQMAIGSDMLFTLACQKLGIPQRIFLPQHLDAYLLATGSGGEPDFSSEQKACALRLLQSPHIIQERMVSDSAVRHERFEECNQEIARVSDVVICMLQRDVTVGPGGTAHLLDLALRTGKPVLEIRVSLENSAACVDTIWHRMGEFQPPMLPEAVRDLPAPAINGTPSAGLATVDKFSAVLKQHVSRRSVRASKFFSMAAIAIIGTHVFATLLASAVLGFYTGHESQKSESKESVIAFAILLGLEFVLLFIGFRIHAWVHREKPQQRWAASRLVAEISRSVQSLGNVHIYLQYLFRLGLPDELTPLLRTLNVLHLRSTRPFRNDAWEPMRDQYLQKRLLDSSEKSGQIRFFASRHRKELKWLVAMHWIFVACSSVAIVATLWKLSLILNFPFMFESWKVRCEVCLGILAVCLPAVAVGALSWAAAKDYEARVHTFDEMHTFLLRQVDLIRGAKSAHEFRRRVIETEHALLTEIAQWFARRKFAGIA